MDIPADPYAFWRAALDGAVIGSYELPIFADRPQYGFYRVRQGIRAPWQCVAIFEAPDGKPKALLDNKPCDALAIWGWCCTHPITEAAYRHALETGQWGDVDDAILTLQNQEALPERFKSSVPFERLKQQIDLAVGSAELYGKIADDTTELKAQSLRAKLLELAKSADDLRVMEKAPHFEQVKLVDGVWQPIIKSAQAAAMKIRKALSHYETAKAAQAAQLRTNEPQPSKIISGFGRAASIKDKTVIASVDDWAALFAHYSGDERARAAILKLAERDVADGVTLPGVATKTERDVR